MKIEKQFEASDFELLSGDIPVNPCDGCSNSDACCGCLKGRKYEELIAPYKSANIKDLAEKIALIRKYKSTIKDLESKISATLKELPEEILNNVEIFNSSYVDIMNLF